MDHNACTIEGTLHGIDLIVSTKTESSLLLFIPRQKMKYADQVIAGRGIPVTYYDPPEEPGLSPVIFQ